jgi:hypothetical protein
MKWARLSIILGLLVAVAGLLTWALWGKLEWSEQNVWVGYSGEARVNDFLAAQRLLERLGQRTSSIRGLPGGKHLPGGNDVLLLPRRQVRMTPGQAKELLRWVRQGGLLITEGLNPESRDASETQDPLFRDLGARLVWRPERVNLETNPETGQDPKTFDETNRNVPVDIGGQTYRVRLGAWSELLDLRGEATRFAKNDSGIKLLQYDQGDGRVILCTDLSCFDNGNIAEEDHAGFLAALVMNWSAENHAWIVYREEPPSLWRWLQDNAWRVMVALGVLTAIGLWRAASRFGPRIPDPPEGRRSLLEHLTACGRFQWAQRDGVSLIQAARQATLARVYRVHPGWGHLEPAELHARLAELSGLSEGRIARALHQERFREPREFTEAIQTLDLLRKKP